MGNKEWEPGLGLGGRTQHAEGELPLASFLIS